MSDTNFDEDTGVQAGQNGSSSESSDMSIEKLNPEDVDVPETKTVEDDEEVPNKEKENDTEEESNDTKESKTEDPDASKDVLEESKVEEDESKKAPVSPPSTSSSSKVVAREIVSTADSDEEEDDDDDDDFDDETLMERLVGLAEMFPSGLITGISSVSQGSVNVVKWSYSKSRSLTWIVFSTAAILFLPAMLESERATIEEQDKMRKHQMLLGPSSALSSAQNAPLPPNPA